jgi:hypothetical protein
LLTYLKITTQLDNYSLEIIVGIINGKTNTPFNGAVRINNLSASEFSQGFYEVKYLFREAGNTSIVVELGQGRKIHKTDINVEVNSSYR